MGAPEGPDAAADADGGEEEEEDRQERQKAEEEALEGMGTRERRRWRAEASAITKNDAYGRP